MLRHEGGIPATCKDHERDAIASEVSWVGGVECRRQQTVAGNGDDGGGGGWGTRGLGEEKSNVGSIYRTPSRNQEWS